MIDIRVGVDDSSLYFDGPVPFIRNANTEPVHIWPDAYGTFAEAKAKGALSVRFADGEVVPVGRCGAEVPADKFLACELTFELVAPPSAKRTNLLYSDTITTVKSDYSDVIEKQLSGTGLSNSALVKGNTYLVVFDGVEYICKAQLGSDGGSWLAVGNMYLRCKPYPSEGFINGDPYEAHDEPFAFQYWGGYRLTTREAGEHTFELWECEVSEETVTNALTVELQPDERGFWTLLEGGEKVLASFEVQGDSYGVSSSTDDDSFVVMEVGKEYVLRIGDVERRGVAMEFEGAPFVGNPKYITNGLIAGDVPDYFFSIASFDGVTNAEVLVVIDRPDLEGATAIISEVGEPTFIKKLSEKVLPTTGDSDSPRCGIFVVNVTVSGDGDEYTRNDVLETKYTSYANNLTIDKTYEEIEQAIAGGALPVVKVTKMDEYDGWWHHFVAQHVYTSAGEGAPDNNTYYSFDGATVCAFSLFLGVGVRIFKDNSCEVITYYRNI